MIAGMTYYEILWFFLIYSFIGWIVEVAYHGAGSGVIVNRGFLNGPVCPIYGVGVVSVLAMLGGLPEGTLKTDGTGGLLTIFLVGMFFATMAELIAGWAMDKLFHARWWDYSDRPFNLHGYICLPFSIIWGLAITFVVRIWHMDVTLVIMELLNPSWGWILLIVLYVLYFADFVVSVATVAGLNKKLEALDKARAAMRIVSDDLTERIGNKSLEAAQLVGEGQVQAALAKAELKQAATGKRDELVQAAADKKEEFIQNAVANCQELEKQIDELSARLTKGAAARMLKAFPGMQHRDYAETLNDLKKMISGKKQ